MAEAMHSTEEISKMVATTVAGWCSQQQGESLEGTSADRSDPGDTEFAVDGDRVLMAQTPRYDR